MLDGLSSTWVDVQRDELRLCRRPGRDQPFRSRRGARRAAFEHRLFETSLGEAIILFGQIARRFDLSVVDQPERDRDGDELIVEAGLFQSGRPAIVSLYPEGGAQARPRSRRLGRQPAAARAIGDAVPFLTRGKTSTS